MRRNAEGRAARAQSLNKSDPSVEAAALGEPRQSAADVRAMGSSPPLLPSSSMFHLCYFGARRGGLRTAASLDFPLYRPPALSSPLLFLQFVEIGKVPSASVPWEGGGGGGSGFTI